MDGLRSQHRNTEGATKILSSKGFSLSNLVKSESQ